MANSSALDNVSHLFHQWRSGKKHRDPIPSQLWDKVAAISSQHSISELCKRLRISYSQYREHVVLRISNTTNNLISAPTMSVECINVTPLIAEQIIEQKSPMVLEFIRHSLGLYTSSHWTKHLNTTKITFTVVTWMILSS